jgi:hypothetical protein
MSTWYNYDVKAIAADEKAVKKFFNLPSDEDVRTERFEFSFGAKNGCGMNLKQLAKQNPDIVFLVSSTIECQTGNDWIQRFDSLTNEMQEVLLYSTGEYDDEINKKVLEEYSKEYPTLVAKHLANEKGYEGFRWSQFLDFNRAALILRREDQYKEMVSLMASDNDILDNDFSHLEMNDL